MKHNILSMPALYLYLMFVVTLLVMALWERETGRPVGKARTTTLTIGRGVADARMATGCNRDRAPGWSSAWSSHGNRRPFRDLQASLSASYAATLEQAIRTLRIGPPVGVRPTDQAVG
jgi:hypothetical protein